MSGLLEATGISKSFAGIQALQDVTLSVDAQQRTGLIGPNGAGKTTFFNCLLGVLAPDEGEVRFKGQDMGGVPVSHRARAGIGRTFQRIELFDETSVFEHLFIAERVRNGSGAFWKDLVGLGRPKPAEINRCREMLDLLGLLPVADEPIEALSLGQGRLVEVGRALMTNPELLLLDEPSSGLDRKETAALAATLRAVQAERGFAILLVEHDIELVADFTEHTYVLDFGTLIASGPTSEVLDDPEVRASYLGTFEAEA